MRRTLLLVLLLVAACGSGPAEAPPDIAGEWVLTDGVEAPPSGDATLLVEGDELSGTSFCNLYSGSYRRDGDSFSVADLGGTEMGCDPDVMAAESAYLAALGSVARAVVDDGDLVLAGEGSGLRFSRVEPVADSELAGTRWLLDTLVHGETASSTGGDAPAELVLRPEGTATASTGCRTVTGTWLLEDDALIIDDLLVTGECPADVSSQDGHVTAVLQSGPAVEIREDRLTLTAPDGRGLSYRAR